MAALLPRSFYARPVLVVARDCIGRVLVHWTEEGETAGRIVEAEAYRGPKDRAAHSHRGLTKRTRVMFGPPGHAYVYLLYGMHWAMNLVCGREGEPHCVLVRAIEPLRGHELMARRRGMEPHRRELTNGPGKVCAALGIDGSHYGVDLCSDGAALWLEDGPRGALARSPRRNIGDVGPWTHMPWRHYERDNPWVSK